MEPNAIAEIYASSIVSTYDLHKPEIASEMFRKYNGQGIGMFDMLRVMGFEKPTANSTYSHFEEKRIHAAFKSRSAVSDPGAGNAVTVVLHTDNLDSNNRFYPRVGDIVQFTNEVVGRIYEIDTTTPADPQIKVRPSRTVDNIGAIAAGDTIIIISNAFAEGSAQPKAAFRGATKITNYCQIIKESIGVTGSELTNQVWIDTTTKGGPYWTTALMDGEYRQRLRIDHALLMSEETTNTSEVDPETGYPIKTTIGLNRFVRSGGNPFTRASGAATVDDFETYDRLLIREGVGEFVVVASGVKRDQNYTRILKDYFADTNIQYTREHAHKNLFTGANTQAKAAVVSFKYFSMSAGRTYCMKEFGNFSHPDTLGATGFTHEDKSFIIPANAKSKDAKSGKMVQHIGCRYKALGNYNRRLEVWGVNGAGNGMKVTQFDRNDTYWRSDIGAHYRGANQMILVHV